MAKLYIDLTGNDTARGLYYSPQEIFLTEDGKYISVLSDIDGDTDKTVTLAQIEAIQN